MQKWYNMTAQGSALAIDIHEEIGAWGVNAQGFLAELGEHKGVSEISVSINSPGGSVFDGLAIYNALRNHTAKITTRVEGIAASIASIIFLAGDVREMPEDAFLMIHNPWTYTAGDADTLREQADVLDQLRDSLLNVYQKATGKERDELAEMLNSETWIAGVDAFDQGFATALLEQPRMAACAPEWGKKFAALPGILSQGDNIAQQMDKIKSINDFEAFLREAGGISKGLAKALTSRAKAIFRREAGNQADAETLRQISDLSNLLKGNRDGTS